MGQAKELQLAIFKIGDEEFGVEISQVIEIIKLIAITPIPKAASFVEGVIDLRGRILAVIDLAKRLNLKSHLRSEKTRIVVVEVDGKIIGMVVDEVTEVLRLSSENIESVPQVIGSAIEHSCIKGVGKLGGGRLLILIDLAKVLSAEEIESIKEMALAR